MEWYDWYAGWEWRTIKKNKFTSFTLLIFIYFVIVYSKAN
jgi:hypothetical protein